MPHRLRHIPLSNTSLLLIAAVLLSIGMMIAFVRYLQPPNEITIAAGSRDGAYYAYALRYRKELARHGIHLTILETSGAMENLSLLSSPSKTVQLALVQGGVADNNKRGLRSLGRYFYEPVWIFRKKPASGDQIGSLRGLRIGVGAKGSGTNVLARQMLSENGITHHNAQLLDMTTEAAIDAVRMAEIDAFFIVASVEAPIVLSLLQQADLEVFSFSRAEGYARRFHFLAHTVLYRGAVDFAADIPKDDIDLVATTAAIVIRDDLHPSLAYLLAEVAANVHVIPSRMERPGEFPKLNDPEFEMAEAATRFHRHGAPYFQRNFSFWTADLIERLLLIGLPMLAIGIPLVRGLRLLYCSAVRYRIRRYHLLIQEVEELAEHQVTLDDKCIIFERLGSIEKALRQAPIPLEFLADAQAVFDHIDRVRRQMKGPQK